MEQAITREALAKILQDVNVADLARRSLVAEKTIYRLRHRKHAPSLDTVAKLLRAVDEIRADAAGADHAADSRKKDLGPAARGRADAEPAQAGG